MQIFVDADACPVVGIELTEAERRPYAIHQSGKWYTYEDVSLFSN